jgi:hypothetical protein
MGVVIEMRRPAPAARVPFDQRPAEEVTEMRRVTTVLRRALDAVAPAKAKDCAAMARTIDEAFKEKRMSAVSHARAEDRDARLLLRLRCDLCSRSCKGRLGPISEELT